MHLSSKILLMLGTIVAIVGGCLFLFAVNDVIPALAYGVLWAAVVLVASRILFALGSGYNRYVGARRGGPTSMPADAAAALGQLQDLRDRGLITPEEYEAKRSNVLRGL